MNLPTVIVLLVVLTLVIIAIKAMRSGKGSCACEEVETKKESKCASCSANCPLKGK